MHHMVAMSFGVSGLVREKGYYKTADGTRMILKTKDAHKQILARYQIIEHCKEAGFPWMDHYYLSRQGLPYVFSEGDNFIMTGKIPYREADFSDLKEFIQVVQTVARWHSFARDINFPGGANLSLSNNNVSLTETFRIKELALESIHKNIRRQSQWSDFDVLFIKNYPGYRETINKALKLLESTKYLGHWQRARQMNHICHGRLKEDCLRICEKSGDVYITKLDFASVDYQLTDLWGLIRRREKGNAINHSLRNSVIKAYSEILPLEPEEEVILEAMLLYPLGFVKIVTEYYKKKRTWTPIALTNKMLEVLTKEPVTDLSQTLVTD